MTTILTSLHGKEFGLDKDRYVTTPVGFKGPAIFLGTSGSEVNPDAITQATVASTGTNINNSGVTELTSTAAKAYLIDDPSFAGQRKQLSQTSSSTAAKTVTTAGGAGIGFDGLNHIATFLGRGDALSLIAKSTAMWMSVGRTSSVTLTTA